MNSFRVDPFLQEFCHYGSEQDVTKAVYPGKGKKKKQVYIYTLEGKKMSKLLTLSEALYITFYSAIRQGFLSLE